MLADPVQPDAVPSDPVDPSPGYVAEGVAEGPDAQADAQAIDPPAIGTAPQSGAEPAAGAGVPSAEPDAADSTPQSDPVQPDAQAPAKPHTRHRSRRGGLWAAVRELTVVVVAALVISALVRTFLVQAFWVPSGSMEETLIRNDRILAWKPASDPGHGDVIVFHDPADWLADPVPAQGWRAQLHKSLVFLGIVPSASGDDLVKRVIGVGGDTVECCSPDGRIIRNGTAITEPYIYPGQPTDQVRFKVTVPEGRLFVMGDHRSDSADSRFHMEVEQGTVPVSSVVGRAILIMWPPERWATLPNYQAELP